VNGPREIDVDILDIGGMRRDRADPILPHPRLASRRFALVPLAEIRADWVDPRSGLAIADLIGRLSAKPRVTRLRGTGIRKRRT
jgi:2-amino-4-hydroxy-6-hydroxymethyldihydropteridine diphosphokinase